MTIELGQYVAFQKHRRNHCMCEMPRIKLMREMVHILHSCAQATI
jgi:hypothetical protein